MTHTCQEDLVLKVTQTDVPYFNAPIYLENKEQVIYLECSNIIFAKTCFYSSDTKNARITCNIILLTHSKQLVTIYS